MRTPHFILGCLIAMWLVIAAVLTVPTVENSKGIAHANEQYQSLKQGGSGAARHGPTLSWLAWLFACSQTLLFLGCLVLGIRRPHTRLAEMWPLMVYTGLMIALLTAIFLVYRRDLTAPNNPTFWGPFPLSTSLVLFGVWFLPMLVVLFYSWKFDSMVFTAEDAHRFQQLVAKRKASEPMAGEQT